MIAEAAAAAVLVLIAAVFTLNEWARLDKARKFLLYKERQLDFYKRYRRHYTADRLEHGRLRYELKRLRRHWRSRLALDIVLVLFVLSLGIAIFIALLQRL